MQSTTHFLDYCSTERLFPQAHFDGISEGDQPWKAPLWRAKLCSVRGRAVNQVDDPFSVAKLTALRSETGKFSPYFRG